MAWIRTIEPEAATGALRAIYDSAVRRAGRVFHILRLQSLQPDALLAMIALYQATTTATRSPLPRWFRELIAVRVSRHNRCFY